MHWFDQVGYGRVTGAYWPREGRTHTERRRKLTSVRAPWRTLENRDYSAVPPRGSGGIGPVMVAGALRTVDLTMSPHLARG